MGQRPVARLLVGVGAFVLTLLILAGAASASVRTSATDHDRPELLKTLDIGKAPFQNGRSVMSIPPTRLGSLIRGDKISGFGEAEITICLKPRGGHSGQPCVGEMYAYNPIIKAKLVLGPDAGASNGSNTVNISKTRTLTCRQDHPNRNHHCIISVPWSKFKVKDPGSLPCNPSACHLNMIVSAHHPSAGSGEKVVVGSSDDNKKIHQSLGKLSAVRYRGKSKAKSWRGGRATKKIPVASKNGSLPKRVIYSAKVSKLKAGDQLVVDAKARTDIKRLGYNVFQRTEVVLAKTPGSIKQYGKVSESTARVSASNGMNCTQGKSAHHSGQACELRKGGVLSIKKNAKGPFYVNIVAGTHVIGDANQLRRWRSGDTAAVPRSGYVKVKRYRGGTSACKTCATGWVKFAPYNLPNSDKPARLVKQLNEFGITDGAYNCKTRRDPVEYVCQWRAEGKIAKAPAWKCESKAWYRPKSGTFEINVCKEQLASQLWAELLKAVVPVEPSFTGVCKEQGNGDFVCKWFGEGLVGDLLGKFCKGYARYDIQRHTWSLDRCKL